MRNDDEIKDDILAELDWDPRITSSQVGVTVKDGAVTLLGTVGTYSEKLAAERAAKRVQGVRAIAEEINVKYPGDTRVTDEEIAERIANMLEWNVSIPNNDIQAEVRNGYVTLSGEAEWNYQREIANTQVAGVKGVVGVSNQIKVKSKVAPSDIEKAIKRALHRNAEIEASHIDVDIDGGKVTLKGDVKAWYERKLIEDAAWAAPGVTHVVDNLRVS